MNREDVIRMAREAGSDTQCFQIWPPTFRRKIDFTMADLERFAALVAAAEREACAIACEVHATAVINDGKQPAWAIANECAAAIRTRGNK